MRVEPLPVSHGLLPGYLRVAARVCYGRRGLKPEVLWFDLPEAYREDVSDAANGWLIALLPLAVRMAEPLQIDAPVDPTLLQNTGEILRIWSTWDPSLKPVPIEACGEPDAAGPGAGKTGLFFSGGVDSFFSVLHWDEVTCAQGAAGLCPVDDLIFVWGYDIPLKHRRAFARKREALAEVARQLGKNLIPVVTNLRETRLGALAWGAVLHGAALGAAGLVLDARFSRLLISSAFQRTILDPWGSHPHVDPLMSTRRTEFIYYGDAFDRYEKTAFIVRSDVALRHLHVCWGAGSDHNCGQCEKCYRTLLSLELLGVRDQAASFPRDRFSLEHVPSIRLGSAVAMKLLAEVRDRAVQQGRSDVAGAIEECLANNPAAGLEKKLPRWRRTLREVREGVRSRLLFG
jgi:hypothetical protein